MAQLPKVQKTIAHLPRAREFQQATVSPSKSPNDDAWRKKRNNCAAQQPCAHQLSESRFENLRIEVVELSGAHQGIDINVFAVKLLTPIT